MDNSSLGPHHLVTLSRCTIQEQSRHGGSTGDLTLLLTSIQVACKFIASEVRRAGLAEMTGLAGYTNVQGESVKKLDVVSNKIFIECLKTSGKVSILVSEENENEIIVDPIVKSDDPKQQKGRYCVVFDPLDGSSNIEAGVSIGSIFGIYHTKTGMVQDVLRPGKELVAAGYALYGSFTAMVISAGDGVQGYTLDPNIGEFILTQNNIQIPERGKIYSINEGNSEYWDPVCKEYFGQLKAPGTSFRGEKRVTPYSARYVGSMVADVHRTLLYGGIFAYPGDKKSPQGKLRLLYECFPMAFLVQQAGGLAITGDAQPILSIAPKSIHERSSIILGSKMDIQDYQACYNAKNI
jgi:fructose-1,6-bisphosphatase I